MADQGLMKATELKFRLQEIEEKINDIIWDTSDIVFSKSIKRQALKEAKAEYVTICRELSTIYAEMENVALWTSLQTAMDEQMKKVNRAISTFNSGSPSVSSESVVHHTQISDVIDFEQACVSFDPFGPIVESPLIDFDDCNIIRHVEHSDASSPSNTPLAINLSAMTHPLLVDLSDNYPNHQNPPSCPPFDQPRTPALPIHFQTPAQPIQSQIPTQPVHPESSPDPENAHSQHLLARGHPSIKPIKIPKFDGGREEWHSFWYLFENLVHNGPEQEFVKFARLRDSLGTKPKSHIRYLGGEPGDYGEAINILKNEYGQEDRPGDDPIIEVSAWNKVGNRNFDQLQEYRAKLRVIVGKMRTKGWDKELNGESSGTLLNLLLQKLPEGTVYSYQRWIREKSKRDCILNLNEWLEEYLRIEVRTRSIFGKSGSSTSIDEHKSKDVKSDRVNNLTRRSHYTKHSECNLCSSTEHSRLEKCPDFLKADVDERWELAKKCEVCFHCLMFGHLGNACRQKTPCKAVQNCKRKHHSLLHSFASKSRAQVTCGESAERFALRTVTADIVTENKSCRINILLDDGSNDCFVTQDVCNQLQLHGNKQKNFDLHNAGGGMTSFPSCTYDIEVRSVDGKFSKKIQAQSCPNRITGNYKATDWTKAKHAYDKLSKLEFIAPVKPLYIDLVLGINYPEFHASLKEVHEGTYASARLGPLGWSAVGRIKYNNSNTSFFTDVKCCDVDNTLREMMSIQTPSKRIDRRTIMTEEEKRAMDILKNTIKQDPDTGMYQVGTPWKNGPPDLVNNEKLALKRWKSVEKRMENDPDLRQAYHETINEYIEQGYVREVTGETEQSETTWYLPHFAVLKAQRETTRYRIVFDGAATNELGQSLNSHILPGPALQANLFELLLKFRRYQIAVICDIKQMYLQIQVPESDRKYFRFFYRFGPNEPIKVMEFSRVLFGIASAPAQSNFVAQEHARRHAKSHPIGSRAILEDTYIDDTMTSVPSDDEAIEFYKQTLDLWQRANMSARKWMTNSEALKAIIPTDLLAQSKSFDCNKGPIVTTLGMVWLTEPDTLKITTAYENIPPKITKRVMSALLGALFDPIGLMSPFEVQAKLLLRRMWENGYGWDDRVDENLASDVKDWFSQIDTIKSIEVPRSLSLSNNETSYQLVCFSDASKDAIGCAIYMRIQYADGSISSRLITAKCKVAPLISVTIPKLELEAASECLKHAETVAGTYQIELSDVTFYVDSVDVLHWIKGNGKELRPFMKFRVGGIQSLTSPSQWFYVPTDQNPSDLCTRNTRADQLRDSQLYWTGPEFLKLPSSEWPKDIPGGKRESEKKTNDGNSKTMNSYHMNKARVLGTDRLDPERYSSFAKMTRVFAWILRVKTVARKQVPIEPYLSTQEIQSAETALIQRMQLEAYSSEILDIRAGKQVSTKSEIAKLVPFLDKDGTLRCYGRLKNSTILSYDEKHPIILSRKHAISELIVRDLHKQNNHAAGVNHLMSEITRRFWCDGIRELCRRVIETCNMCKRYKAKPTTPFMASLPLDRLGEVQKPFTFTSVDMAGPYLTKQGRGKVRAKRWICVFTCCSTRAVHLELSHGIDTDSFLRANSRFIARRGCPQQIRSDQGTNFVGAKREIDARQTQIQDYLSTHRIKWVLNCPAAPHQMGIHESIVKCVKRALPKTLNTESLSDEEFYTMLTNVESFLNARPLTYTSSNVGDMSPITPAHFLTMGATHPEIPQLSPAENPPFRTSWKRVQNYSNQLWTRFLKEFLPTLNPRTKWFEKVKDLQVGDVVIVLQEGTPRGQWPLGIIHEVYHGDDDTKRSANVRIGKKYFRRPVVKLIPIITNDN